MYDNLVEIKHYPIGHWSLYRETLEKRVRRSCDNCGNRLGRFVYYTWNDGIRTTPQEVNESFCSKSCMAMYHDFWDTKD